MKKLPLSNPVGRVYSGMTVLGREGYDGRRFKKWRVRCHCGNEAVLGIGNVRDLVTKSCGCLLLTKAAAREMAGQRFGEVVVLRRTGKHDSRWIIRCACGTESEAARSDLQAGKIQSCGCRKVTHGHTRGPRGGYNTTPEYRCWSSMLNRCSNPNNQAWHNYGGRGISVCERWRGDYLAFINDMGPRPRGMDLDRVNNDGNYEPGNCRWVSRKENMRNRRCNKIVLFRGARRSLAECAEMTGVDYNLLHQRLGRRWDIERAVSQPAAIKLRRRA